MESAHVNISYIRHWIGEHFPVEAVDEVFEILREFDEKPRPDFTYRAILSLARGDLGEIRRLVRRAKTDAKSVRDEGGRAQAWDSLLAGYGQNLEHWPWIKPFRDFLARLDTTSVRWKYVCGTSHESVCFTLPESEPGEYPERLVALMPLTDSIGIEVELRNESVSRKFHYDAPVDELLLLIEQELG